MSDKHTDKTANQPLQRLRDGGVNVTFWEQQTKKDTSFVTINISKTYKDKQGNFREGQSFTANDINKIATLMPVIQQKAQQIEAYFKETGRTPENPKPQNDMAAKRDEVMKSAKDARASHPSQSHENTQEHAPNKGEPDR